MMENEQGKVSMTSKQTGQGRFKCTGDCLKCLPAQRAYCASQHAYSNMKVLDSMMAVVLSMQEDVMAMSEKIDAIVNNEALVFAPHDEEAASVMQHRETAQEGLGA